MSGTLGAARTNTVMASGGITIHAGNGGMIKGHTQPGGSIMANITGLSGGNVRWTFTCGHRVVVAVFTQVRGLGMIKRQTCRYPRAIDMTGFTQIAGDRVNSRLVGSGTHTIVTTRTETSRAGLGMIKRHHWHHEICGVMTQLTSICGHRVVHTFCHCNGTVMAITAYIRGLAMIKWNHDWHPHTGAMTRLTQITGHRMSRTFESARTDTVMASGVVAGLPGYAGVIERHS